MGHCSELGRIHLLFKRSSFPPLRLHSDMTTFDALQNFNGRLRKWLLSLFTKKTLCGGNISIRFHTGTNKYFLADNEYRRHFASIYFHEAMLFDCENTFWSKKTACLSAGHACSDCKDLLDDAISFAAEKTVHVQSHSQKADTATLASLPWSVTNFAVKRGCCAVRQVGKCIPRQLWPFQTKSYTKSLKISLYFCTSHWWDLKLKYSKTIFPSMNVLEICFWDDDFARTLRSRTKLNEGRAWAILQQNDGD